MTGAGQTFNLPKPSLTGELFTTQENRDNAKLEKVSIIPLSEIDDFQAIMPDGSMVYLSRGADSNKDNGSWAGSIYNESDNIHTNSKEGVLNQIKGWIELYASDGYSSITIDYKHNGNGIYEFFVIFA